MIVKKIDNKQDQINSLKKLYKTSQSQKQKALIKKELTSLENGYKNEKENAYYLDFSLKDSTNVWVLHDLRIEHNGRSAQIDHLLITRLGIEVLESKSINGKLTINDDGSLTADYGKTTHTLPNPIEQNNRHIEVLKEFLNDNGIKTLTGDLYFENCVLLHNNTTVTNQKLPDGYVRADSYITKRMEEVENLSVGKTLLRMAKLISKDKVKEIAKLLRKAHKPAIIDYSKKYKIAKNDNIEEQKTCPRCQKGKLVVRTTTKKESIEKYGNNKFLGCNRFPKCRYNETIK